MSGNGELKLEDARKVVEDESKKRVQECTKRIDAILQEFNCVAVPDLMIVDGRIMAQIRIVAK